MKRMTHESLLVLDFNTKYYCIDLCFHSALNVSGFHRCNMALGPQGHSQQGGLCKGGNYH